MKNAKKIVALLLCAVLLIGASVASTLAYLTHKTGTVTNTFTVGKVDLGEDGEGLDEADVNEYGEKLYVSGGTLVTEAELAEGEQRVLANRVKENKYKLIPGHTYTKDPTIHILAGSEDCYLFVKVVNGISAIEADGDTTIAEQMEVNGWTQLVVDGQDVANVYCMAAPVETEADKNNDVPVFGSFTLATDAPVANYADAKIIVTAYAIQADGFVDENNNGTAADEAWGAAPSDWK